MMSVTVVVSTIIPVPVSLMVSAIIPASMPVSLMVSAVIPVPMSFMMSTVIPASMPVPMFECILVFPVPFFPVTVDFFQK